MATSTPYYEFSRSSWCWNDLLSYSSPLQLVKPPRIIFCLKLSTPSLEAYGLFIGSKQALEALGIPEKSYLSFLVKLGTNPNINQNRIRQICGHLLQGYFGIVNVRIRKNLF
jgi:hypothetical protein